MSDNILAKAWHSTYVTNEEGQFSWADHFFYVPKTRNNKFLSGAEWAAYLLGGFIVGPVISVLDVFFQVLPGIFIEGAKKLSPEALPLAILVLPFVLLRSVFCAALSPVKSLERAMSIEDDFFRRVAVTASVLVSAVSLIAIVTFAPLLMAKMGISTAGYIAMRHNVITKFVGRVFSKTVSVFHSIKSHLISVVSDSLAAARNFLYGLTGVASMFAKGHVTNTVATHIAVSAVKEAASGHAAERTKSEGQAAFEKMAQVDSPAPVDIPRTNAVASAAVARSWPQANDAQSIKNLGAGTFSFDCYALGGQSKVRSTLESLRFSRS